VAATAAGTLIKNLATVTYEDANGNKYSAQSNEAVVTVAAVYSATIENDNTLSAAPGQTVYFPHIVENTGNIADSYTINATAAGDGVVVYNDLNSNGQPDPGEPVVPAGGKITIAAGEQANLVVAMAVPTTAADNTSLTTKLSAVSDHSVSDGAVVTDIGDNDDKTNGTNDDVANVSTGPVLVLNKSSVHDPLTNTITYTLTVKNNGGSEAKNVNIIDALPEVDSDNNGVLDTQLTFESTTSNGLVNTTAGDVPPALQTGLVEATLGADINQDNDSLDTLDAIVAKDVNLPPNTTVSVTYTVSYEPTWAAGTDIDNTFVSFDDPNNDGTPDDSVTGVVPSNTTHDVLPQTYGVTAEDNKVADTSLGLNDGKDDDGTAANDVQEVDIVPTGAEVLFTHNIANNGNGDDTFNVDVESNATNGFPAGTVFTYWDATGTVQLTDTDNDGVPDTGSLAAGADTTIMVKAKLPAGISGKPANGYNATLTAVSSNDPAATPQADTTTLTLLEITAPTVDIANAYPATFTLSQGDDLAAGFNDNGAANTQDEAPAYLVDAPVNSTVTFDLKLANESGSADSFLLSATNVPDGWNVVFKDENDNVITTTTLVPGVDAADATKNVFNYKAVVTIPADTSKARSNSDQAGATDGYDAVEGGTALTANDGDLDYRIDFGAASTSTPGIGDTVTNAIDIIPDREVVITPNGQNQIQPGGTVDYSHKLENNGNQVETVELDVGNTQTGWTTIINVDTTGDGNPDTILVAPPQGTTAIIKGVDADGNTVDIEVTDADGDGIPELFLEPGEDVSMVTTVNAPSNAPLGSTDLSTLTVTDADPTSTTLNDELDTAQDQTTVVLGQVRLEKSAAIDVGCDGDLDTGFSANQTTEVKPEDCVTWQLHATNEGNATVKNVVISDAAPAFTDLVENFLKFCHGNSCSVGTVTDVSTDTDGGSLDLSTGIVTFKPVGGQLLSGETATGQFTVKVQ
jgi:uncharacterized repeat protein (TIGR01451 family)